MEGPGIEWSEEVSVVYPFDAFASCADCDMMCIKLVPDVSPECSEVGGVVATAGI